MRHVLGEVEQAGDAFLARDIDARAFPGPVPLGQRDEHGAGCLGACHAPGQWGADLRRGMVRIARKKQQPAGGLGDEFAVEPVGVRTGEAERTDGDVDQARGGFAGIEIEGVAGVAIDHHVCNAAQFGQHIG